MSMIIMLLIGMVFGELKSFRSNAKVTASALRQKETVVRAAG